MLRKLQLAEMAVYSLFNTVRIDRRADGFTVCERNGALSLVSVWETPQVALCSFPSEALRVHTGDWLLTPAGYACLRATASTITRDITEWASLVASRKRSAPARE